jgi:hypothetical protein
MLTLLFFLFMQPAVTQSAVDVPAISYQVPPSHPCNLPSGGSADGTMTYAVCITGPETRTTCADKSRVLLTSEDGVAHCIKFPYKSVSTPTKTMFL